MNNKTKIKKKKEDGTRRALALIIKEFLKKKKAK
jgi:hypothetical protein